MVLMNCRRRRRFKVELSTKVGMAEFTSAPIKLNLSAVGIRLRLKWHPDSTVLIGTERANVSRLVCWSETGMRRGGIFSSNDRSQGFAAGSSNAGGCDV